MRDVKYNKKGFYTYMNSKMKTRVNVTPLLCGARDLVIKDMGKTRVYHVFFASVFTSKTSFQESKAPETHGTVWSREDLPLVEKDHVR